MHSINELNPITALVVGSLQIIADASSSWISLMAGGLGVERGTCCRCSHHHSAFHLNLIQNICQRDACDRRAGLFLTIVSDFSATF